MLVQRVHQSGPLAGSKPARFRKAHPPQVHAEAALSCVEAALEADHTAGHRVLTSTQRNVMGQWRDEAVAYLASLNQPTAIVAAGSNG